MPTTTTYYSRGVHGHKNKNNAPQILKTQKINHELICIWYHNIKSISLSSLQSSATLLFNQVDGSHNIAINIQ